MTKRVRPNGEAIRQLIDYISRRKLREGHRLPSIKELAGEMQVGPHAVRDALLQAQTMGLVRVRPRSGSYVQSVNFAPLVEVFSQSLPRALTQEDRNLFDLLEARRLIEVELTGLAAARRRLGDMVPLRDALRAMYANPNDYEAYMTQNEVFHLAIARVAGNQVLLTVVQALLALLRPTLGGRQPATWQDRGSEKRRRDAAEHEAIFEALLAGDAAAARAAMTAHLQDTTESLIPTSGVKSSNSGA
jgi:GntR family transcriptional regulator, transcriptional repressor for pyruvate dehydrogenase complex